MTCPQWSWKSAIAAMAAASLLVIVGCGGEAVQDTAKPGGGSGAAPKINPDPAANIKIDDAKTEKAPKADKTPDAKADAPADKTEAAPADSAKKGDETKKDEGDGGLELEAPAIDSPTAKKKG